jgi:hypothetical protein
MKPPQPPQGPAPSQPHLTPDQAATLISGLPDCKLVHRGRSLQLLRKTDPQDQYGALFFFCDVFLLGLERENLSTTIRLVDGHCLRVLLSTPGEGVTLADIHTAQEIVARWSLTRSSFDLR